MATAAGASAQSWISAYDAGLQAGHKLHWSEARTDFKQAAAYRPDDVSKETILPGPPTAQRKWRDGAPYSPNFLAAYAGYRQALTLKGADQAALLKLLAKHQVSKESYYVVSQIYATLGDQDKLRAAQIRYGAESTTSTWRVDDELVSPEELATINGSTPVTTSPTPQPTKPAVTNPSTPNQTPIVLTPGGAGSVPVVPTKYALIVGIRTPGLTGNLAYAADDAIRVRDALVNYAGYAPGNVEVVTDATAPVALQKAKDLASRMPDSATLCVYCTGVGVNIGGKDYIAASDTQSLTDRGTMIGKSDLFAAFVPKSARIFSFFQIDRSGPSDSVFGSELSMVGSVSQMESTVPGDPIYTTFLSSKTTGLFTDSFVATLRDLSSNKLPILEFGWQVFSHMRKGESGSFGGASLQTCTLPRLNNLASDASF
jgi:hypothetical protein